MLSKQSLEAGSAPYVEVHNTTRDAIEQHILRMDIPIELISKMLAASAGATMDLIVLKPAVAAKYRDGGFEIYWSGIARK